MRLKAVRLLEVRLLVHSDERHTETGAHAKFLQTWRGFAANVTSTDGPARPVALWRLRGHRRPLVRSAFTATTPLAELTYRAVN